MRLTLVLGLLLAGCGGTGSSSSSASGSCDTQSVNSACIDYSGPAAIIAEYKSACSGGTWRDGGCPHANSVGGCRASDTTLKLTYTTWQYPPQTTDAVKQACQAPEVFVTP
jgi:hypothetical protein